MRRTELGQRRLSALIYLLEHVTVTRRSEGLIQSSENQFPEYLRHDNGIESQDYIAVPHERQDGNNLVKSVLGRTDNSGRVAT